MVYTKIRGLLLAACCSAFAVTGCSSGGGGDSDSGGGGGGGSTDPIQIDSSNSGRVGKSVYDAQAGLNNAGNFAGGNAGVKSADGGPFAVRGLAALALEALRVAKASKGPAGGGTSMVTLDCDNVGVGTFTLSVTDVNGNGDFDSGDSIGIAYVNCDFGGFTSNGTFTITFNTVTGDPDNDAQPWTLSMTLSFDDFSQSSPEFGDSFSDGSLTFTTQWDGAGTLTLTMNGSNLTMVQNGETLDLSGTFSFTAITDDNGTPLNPNDDIITINYTMTVEIEGLGTVTVSTPDPLTGGPDGIPQSGTILVQGDGSSLSITFTGGGGLTVAIDSNGDSVIDCSQDLTVDTIESFDPGAC